MIQVSFRLLANAELLSTMEEDLEKKYKVAQERAWRRYKDELFRLRQEYAPYFASLRRDREQFWREVTDETGVQDTENYYISGSGFLRLQGGYYSKIV